MSSQTTRRLSDVGLHTRVSCIAGGSTWSLGGGSSRTNAEILQYMINAGFSSDELARGLATVWGESGGCPNAWFDNGAAGRDQGLWQINAKYHAKKSVRNSPWNGAGASKIAKEVHDEGGDTFRLWHATTNSEYNTNVIRAEKLVNAYLGKKRR